jgi:hypothetical protein
MKFFYLILAVLEAIAGIGNLHNHSYTWSAVSFAFFILFLTFYLEEVIKENKK